MALTDQERERIIEEEKLRAEIRKREMSHGYGPCPHCGHYHHGRWGGLFWIIVVIFLFFALFGHPWRGWHMMGYYGNCYGPAYQDTVPGPAPAPKK